MTKTEQARYAANFLKRRTSRIVELQSGYNDQLVNFSDPYEHDTLADVNTDTGAPTDTTQVDPADQGIDGTVNREGGVDDKSGDITGAISIIQEHIASLGNADLLDKWASTANALQKTVTSGVAKASPNPEGTTRDPLHVADNTASQNAGPQGYIQTSELQKMETEAGKLTTMTSRIVEVTSL